MQLVGIDNAKWRDLSYKLYSIVKMKVLQIAIGGNSFGGVESFLLQLQRNIDINNHMMDYLFLRENSFRKIEDNELLSMSKVTSLDTRDGIRDYIKLIVDLWRYLKQNTYDIVHINTGSLIVTFFCVKLCNCLGVKRIISHSHSTHSVGRVNDNAILRGTIKILNGYLKRYIRQKSDVLLACSLDAGISLFGDECKNLEKFSIIHNAINLGKFKYDEKKRKTLRLEQNISDDCIVIGHVGRFDDNKNQRFIVSLCSQMISRNINCKVWLVGEGEKQEEIRQYAESLKVFNDIKFWGSRNDVDYLLQGMDVFILPSLFEGLSIVAIEAQASGVPILLSSSLSTEHKIVNNVRFLPLNTDADIWIDAILEMSKETRTVTTSVMREAGYDISKETKKVFDLYEIE